jgi:hypothetical protein
MAAANFLGRKYRIARAAEYAAGPLFNKAFWLQAGQALYSVTSGRYGLILGGLEALKTDVYWSVVKGFHGGNIQINLSPEADVVTRAAQHVATPPWHHGMSSVLSLEDHLALLAVDTWALRTLRAQPVAANWQDRADEFLNTPAPLFVPNNPLTLAVLAESGWRPGDPMRPPFPELSDTPTYGEAYTVILNRHVQALSDLSNEYPLEPLGRFYSLLMELEGEAVFDGLTGVPGSIEPVYSIEELAVARLFEYSVLPVAEPTAEEVQSYVERVVSLTRAVGREWPSLEDVRSAAVEVWGAVGSS